VDFVILTFDLLTLQDLSTCRFTRRYFYQIYTDRTAIRSIVVAHFVAKLRTFIVSARCVRETDRRAIAMMFVRPSVRPTDSQSLCLSGTGVHCDHTVQFSADVTLRLDSPMS